jgi:hypothetical protein
LLPQGGAAPMMATQYQQAQGSHVPGQDKKGLGKLDLPEYTSFFDSNKTGLGTDWRTKATFVA